MGTLYQFEKTDMIQPDHLLFENYQTSKKDLIRINSQNKVDQTRVDILQESNDRLNTEVQRLKEMLAATSKPSLQPNQALIANERKKAVEQNSAIYAQKINILEQNNKQQLKKIDKQAATIIKLEMLLDDVYETENSNQEKQIELDEIKSLNQRLNLLINQF